MRALMQMATASAAYDVNTNLQQNQRQMLIVAYFV
jgi:hypothetical protein